MQLGDWFKCWRVVNFVVHQPEFIQYFSHHHGYQIDIHVLGKPSAYPNTPDGIQVQNLVRIYKHGLRDLSGRLVYTLFKLPEDYLHFLWMELTRSENPDIRGYLTYLVHPESNHPRQYIEINETPSFLDETHFILQEALKNSELALAFHWVYERQADILAQLIHVARQYHDKQLILIKWFNTNSFPISLQQILARPGGYAKLQQFHSYEQYLRDIQCDDRSSLFLAAKERELSHHVILALCLPSPVSQSLALASATYFTVEELYAATMINSEEVWGDIRRHIGKKVFNTMTHVQIYAIMMDSLRAKRYHSVYGLLCLLNYIGEDWSLFEGETALSFSNSWSDLKKW